MAATAITPEHVLRDLREYWETLAREAHEDGGVLKACSMTLIVLAHGDDDVIDVRRSLGTLMHSHPSRAIVIGSRAGEDLHASVFAECWKPFGANQQICSEGIEIAPGRDGLEDVARFLTGLLVPDLPVVMWCRGPLDQTYMYRKRFDSLYALADKAIFDSRTALDAEAAVGFLSMLRRSGRRVADLHWTRLTGWREVLAHLFDDGALNPAQVSSARIGYGRGGAATCALYFGAWIRTALKGVRVAMEEDDAPPGLHSVTLTGKGNALRLTRSDSGLRVEGPGRNYQTALRQVSEEGLMDEELRILAGDPAWERVLSA